MSLTFGERTLMAVADKDGQWAVPLGLAPASAVLRALSVKAAGMTVVLKNVVMGDVFLFARQTSIDISLGRYEAGKKAAAAQGRNQTIPAVRPARLFVPRSP